MRFQAFARSNGLFAEDVKDKDVTVNQLDGLVNEECDEF